MLGIRRQVHDGFSDGRGREDALLVCMAVVGGIVVTIYTSFAQVLRRVI